MVISIPSSPCHLQLAFARCGLSGYIIQNYAMGDKKNADPTLLISEPTLSISSQRSFHSFGLFRSCCLPRPNLQGTFCLPELSLDPNETVTAWPAHHLACFRHRLSHSRGILAEEESALPSFPY